MEITAERVIRALLKCPSLLLEVRALLTKVQICGPWQTTGKRFGNREGNVIGLPRDSKRKHPPEDRLYVATVRPAHEWSSCLDDEDWYWNVDVGRAEERGQGICPTQQAGQRLATEHLRDLGWAVLEKKQ